MASDSRADDAATRSLRRTVEKLVSGLSRAVFGVCAVAVGLIALLVGAGTASESASVFLIVGLASILVGFVTISRLPKPSQSAKKTEKADQIATTDGEPTGEAQADHDESDHNEADHHRQKAD